MNENKQQHISVLLDEVLEHLKPEAGSICVDGTLGLGGHAEAMLDAMGTDGRLIAMDRDVHAIAITKKRLIAHASQCEFVQSDFRHIDQVLESFNVTSVDRILLDLGISSFQIDNPERGFSLRQDGPLDMRMDQSKGHSASELINSLSEKEISTILFEYGQERYANRIAKFIVRERFKNKIETTSQLTQVVLKAMPSKVARQKIHPATRTFQAIRIAVNQELESLEVALDKCVEALSPKGRLGIISFHSLEDRIVKTKFKALEKEGLVKNIFKKPLRPSEEEIKKNPRSRSARLRVIERV